MSIRRAILVGLAVMAALSAASFPALTANNPVPITYASDTTSGITPNNLKPSECNGISLTAKLSGSVTINGGAAAELITASNLADSVSGNNGNDCILGGDGIDTLRGNNNNDVILGGAGVDSLQGGSGTDVCYGGPDVDTFNSCETQIQ
jgi:Ca2+-binding RTX toxin-like protein